MTEKVENCQEGNSSEEHPLYETLFSGLEDCHADVEDEHQSSHDDEQVERGRDLEKRSPLGPPEEEPDHSDHSCQ